MTIHPPNLMNANSVWPKTPKLWPKRGKKHEEELDLLQLFQGSCFILLPITWPERGSALWFCRLSLPHRPSLEPWPRSPPVSHTLPVCTGRVDGTISCFCSSLQPDGLFPSAQPGFRSIVHFPAVWLVPDCVWTHQGSVPPAWTRLLGASTWRRRVNKLHFCVFYCPRLASLMVLLVCDVSMKTRHRLFTLHS